MRSKVVLTGTVDAKYDNRGCEVRQFAMYDKSDLQKRVRSTAEALLQEVVPVLLQKSVRGSEADATFAAFLLHISRADAIVFFQAHLLLVGRI